MSIVKENIDWLEYTYEKLGNQLSLNPIGYKKGKNLPSKHKNGRSMFAATLLVNVTNHGLSDQIHDDIGLRVDNINLHIDQRFNGKKDPNTQTNLVQADQGTDILQ